MDWIIDGSKGIELAFARVFTYLLCGGSVGLRKPALHTSEGFAVDGMDCNIVWRYIELL